MAYCRNCGSSIDDEAQFCPLCGGRQSGARTERSVDDDDSIVWGILGFLLPLIGFILWIIWREEKPKRARTVAIGIMLFIIVSTVIAMANVNFIMSLFESF